MGLDLEGVRPILGLSLLTFVVKRIEKRQGFRRYCIPEWGQRGTFEARSGLLLMERESGPLFLVITGT
jgi:hypothetical protein